MLQESNLAAVAAALEAQGLTPGDVETNRGGRVSPAQLARLGEVMGSGGGLVGTLVAGLGGGSLLAALVHYDRNHAAAIFVLPAVFIPFVAFLYFVVYRGNRLPFPAEVADAKVTVLRARVTGSMLGSARGVYDVWLDGVRYSGCSRDLTEDVRQKGRVVDAYLVPGRKLVVALVPASG